MRMRISRTHTIVMITDVSETPTFGYNPPMHRALRHIAALLLAILLATVLTPSFGWEASAGQGAHGHDIVAPDASDDAHDHDRHAGGHHGDEDSHHHHGCAGHLLGHLPVQLSEAFAFVMIEPDRDSFSDPGAGFPFPFPDRLDRPPLAPALA